MKKYLRAALHGGLLSVVASGLSCSALDGPQKAAEFSCVSSIHAALVSVAAKSNIYTGADAGWRVLSDAEVAEFVSDVSLSHRFDCKGIPTDSSHLHVAVRRHPQSLKTEFIVWLKGADGVSGTPDDVISLPGAKVPPTP